MTGSGRLRLGIDLGTSAVKVAILDDAGEIRAAGEASFPTLADLPGKAEQDPRHWLEATAAAVTTAGAQLDRGWAARIEGLGLAGQLPTLVMLGADGPLGLAITWSDARADAWFAGTLDEERRAHLYGCTGMPVDGRYLAPMFGFHGLAIRASVRAILSAKDYLCQVLTGRAVTDPSTAAGYGVYGLEGGWDPELCEIWNLDPALLPEVGPAASLAGSLQPAAARLLGLPEGLPVAVGAADSVAAAYGMGCLRLGVVSIVTGSSTVIIDSVKERQVDPLRRYLLTPHVQRGWFGREMDLLATGSGQRWLERLFGWGLGEMETRATSATPGARGLYFAPYLAGGEQGALWDPALCGVLHGLALHHSAEEIARAFLEGIQFEIRRCLEVLAGSQPVERVVVAGHMAASVPALQMMADLLGRPVEPFAHHSPAALGAALLAPVSRRDEDVIAVSQRLACVRPGPGSASYESAYRAYLELFPCQARAPARGRE